MPTYQTTAIIIGRTNFGEADRIIRMLTPQFGKVSAVARGVRKITSKLGGHLELFGEVNLQLATGKNLDVITSARLVWYPHDLSQNYSLLPLAFAFATAIDRLIDTGHPQYKLYETLRDSIHALNIGTDPAVLELWFKLRLLDALGNRPDLTACAICGTQDPTQKFALNIDSGSLRCEADASSIDPRIDTNTIKLWRLCFDQTIETITNIHGSTSLAKGSIPLIDQFYEHHIGRSFKPSLEIGNS